MPAYAKNLLPSSVASRPLEGDVPTIDLAIGYSKANTSPILKLFLSRVDELIGRFAPGHCSPKSIQKPNATDRGLGSTVQKS